MTLMTCVETTVAVTVFAIAVEVTCATPLAKASMPTVAADPSLRTSRVSVVGEAGRVIKMVDTGLHAESFLEPQGQCRFITAKSHKTCSLQSETEQEG